MPMDKHELAQWQRIQANTELLWGKQDYDIDVEDGFGWIGEDTGTDWPWPPKLFTAIGKSDKEAWHLIDQGLAELVRKKQSKQDKPGKNMTKG